MRYTVQQLKDALDNLFNESELRELCFLMGKQYEDFGGRTKAVKALEIADWSRRLGRMDELGDLILQKRPHAFDGQAAPGGAAAGSGPGRESGSGNTTIHVHGNIVGSVVGGSGSVNAQNIAGRDIHVQQPTSREDFKAQLAELQQLVQEAMAAGEIGSERDREYVQKDLQEVVDGVEEPEPDGRRLKRRLEDVQHTLEQAAETVQAGGKVATAVAKAAALAATLYQSVQALF